MINLFLGGKTLQDSPLSLHRDCNATPPRSYRTGKCLPSSESQNDVLLVERGRERMQMILASENASRACSKFLYVSFHVPIPLCDRSWRSPFISYSSHSRVMFVKDGILGTTSKRSRASLAPSTCFPGNRNVKDRSEDQSPGYWSKISFRNTASFRVNKMTAADSEVREDIPSSTSLRLRLVMVNGAILEQRRSKPRSVACWSAMRDL